MTTNTAVLGIDIGGTKIALALADANNQILSRCRIPTEVERGPYGVMDKALERIEQMLAETNTRLLAVGCGCGGPLDRRRGLILSPPGLPGWDEFPLVELLEKRLGVPVLLDNDANAAALGEHEYGAGREFSNLIYITISTGIGGGIIINNRLVHGVGDGAGEVGHVTILPDGPRCGCGARGCLEWLCSGTGIARRARARLAEGAPSLMRAMAQHETEVTTEIVVEATQQNDALAREIWNETIRYLSIGINDIIVTLAPEAVILGGGVSTVGELLLEPLRRELEQRVKIVPFERVRLLQAALGGDSGLYGALILGRHALARHSAPRAAQS